MIGKAEWDWRVGGADRPVRVVMVLDDDGTFHSEQMPNYATWLAEECRRTYGGPSDGPYGCRFLAELAREHGGAVEFEPKRRPPPGTVY